MAFMQTLVIINPLAAKARRSWPTIQKQLDAARVEYQTYETNSAGDATSRTRAALRSGVETIVVVGGDGTLSEVAEGFFEFDDDLAKPPAPINPAANLALLPTGTGDDFARGLRGHRAPLQHWIDTVLSFHRGERRDAKYRRALRAL